MPRRLLVTHALPYANGPLHLGHMLGYIQTDIWARAQRMMGNEVHFVAADDAHGTPIMLAAEKAGVSPEAFIADIRAGHEADFSDFHFSFDHYHTTHSEENRELASLIYTRLRDGARRGSAENQTYIARRSIQQLFDPEKDMFLPDRYIKGVCPNCGTPEQYGDNCENCGATYAPTDLINPYSVMSGATPVLRDSEHYFFELSKFEPLLRDWFGGKFTAGKPVANSGVVAKLMEWLDGGLKDWDISRDAPYFGFPIPDAPGKFFYVWLDAPVGYLASFKALCDRTGLTFDDFLAPDSTAEMHHFIGKDIINFHGLFWPAMLHGAQLRTPTALHVNGYLSVNGAKMSKSRGTFIKARTYLDAGLHPEFLRYYFATMLSDAPVDVDLDLKAFEERVNSHLIGKWVNIASRTAGFVQKFFDGKLADHFGTEESALWQTLLAHYDGVDELYETGEFAEVTRRIRHHRRSGQRLHRHQGTVADGERRQPSRRTAAGLHAGIEWFSPAGRPAQADAAGNRCRCRTVPRCADRQLRRCAPYAVRPHDPAVRVAARPHRSEARRSHGRSLEGIAGRSLQRAASEGRAD